MLSGTEDDVSLTAADSAGTSTFSAIETYPKNAGQNNVDLFLKFSLTNGVDMDGIIRIVSAPFTLQLVLAEYRSLLVQL